MTDRYTTKDTMHRVSAAMVAAEQAGHEDIADQLRRIHGDLAERWAKEPKHAAA